MSALPELAMMDSWDADANFLSESIKKLRGPLNILEAGCGRSWPLDLKGVEYRLTGIDLDGEALKSRVEQVGDLHEAIIGDLCAPGMIRTETYDVIYSSFVLEHVAPAEQLLDNMVRGLKPGGLLLLHIPDRDSVFGWTARRSPFGVHVAYYRLVHRYKHAGEPGHPPYPTYHAPIVSRDGIWGFCRKHGCEVLHEHGHSYYVRGKGLRPLAIRLYSIGISVLSLGTLAWRHDNLTYVIRKNGAGVSPTG